MKKGTVIWIVIAAVVAMVIVWGISVHNRIVVAEESVTTQWANVESQYQRRTDLIPNLVSTVKGYAAHESQTLQAVVDARAKATQTTIDPSHLTEAEMQHYQAVQGEVSSALSRLLMVVENYPDLKANQNFLSLQNQLEGTENRISVERQKFNETVKVFNAMIRRFPNSIIAGYGQFTVKAYFAADAGAEKAPEVTF
ncbi:MAG: LemA family protein [Prevotellaceae bacterium]|jgi:LemA protein|nr:LemA family protein [Prevotellaceae bacterium]